MNYTYYYWAINHQIQLNFYFYCWAGLTIQLLLFFYFFECLESPTYYPNPSPPIPSPRYLVPKEVPFDHLGGWCTAFIDIEIRC